MPRIRSQRRFGSQSAQHKTEAPVRPENPAGVSHPNAVADLVRNIFSALLMVLALTLWVGPAMANTLQDMIDAAPDGAEIVPPAGVYTEQIVLTRPITIDGREGVVIDGGGIGTIVTIETDGVTLKNLTLQNSGRLHNKVDAGLRINGSFNAIRDVTIENALFGIDMNQANNNVIRRVHISSKDMSMGLRGDSMRIYYSNNNKVEDSEISDARDIVIWYSEGNIFRRNKISDSRYGIHFMYAHKNIVEDNEISDCVVGVFLMYANNTIVRNNQILRAWGASGVGVGFKESSGAQIDNNNIVGNATGIYLDPSPWDPDMDNYFTDNVIAYNGIGIEFHTDWTGNHFQRNAMMSNFTQVSVRGRGTALREGWEGNYWDDYAGFDKDADTKGDVPYEIYNYADRIWMEVPDASFFRGGLALAALDFVERLAPFSEPRLLVREQVPMMDKSTGQTLAEAKEDAQPKSALEMLMQ
ncbi:nitrous oxide reductase family maturation protein NosD [Aliiroseovarius crassostreae]|uniref:nitrous oxide reductase family maturation protein NosD n=2 Tax=Aliiroseovarius crassostreae TaxID=154981 RepID=UPI0021B08A18|nr:nitrous oxide reductase family maturation protein NosD [Aliiroseovarius crassostreae]UWP92150.1 nitrous oxide reductase family maturation protein NosD [Aliiroseovarius crassostreae]